MGALVNLATRARRVVAGETRRPLADPERPDPRSVDSAGSQWSSTLLESAMGQTAILDGSDLDGIIAAIERP
jgi:hypothetical protein